MALAIKPLSRIRRTAQRGKPMSKSQRWGKVITTMPARTEEQKIEQEEQLSWSELAELTHQTQVDRFNWCSCEDNEGNENPYDDCPTTGENK